MNLKDQWRFVKSNMRRSKSRIFMTVLATAMSVAFLIVLASVGFGLHSTFIQDLLEDRTVTKIEIAGLEQDGNVQPITDKEIKEIEAIDEVKAVTRQQNLYQTPNYTLDNYSSQNQTVVAHFPSEIEAGLELTEGRLPEGSHEIVVGHHFLNHLAPTDVEVDDLYDENNVIKEKFQYDENLIGKQIEMEVAQYIEGKEQKESITLTITGIVEPPSKGWMEDQKVYTTEEVLNEIESFTNTPRGEIVMPDQSQPASIPKGYDAVYGFADSMDEINNISEILKEQNYLVYSVADEIKNINLVFTIAKIGLIFIGTIAIIIASIGIYNTMTMAVTERTPDIGIMKAIGAHPKKIKQIFLLESSYIGLIGAVIGTAVAYIISILLNITLPIIIESALEEQLPEGFQFSSIPLSLILISVTICLLVTIVSGLKPAKRATQIDVLKAMRREI
ncbi:ABC transporter permease [Gracilibacillus kekensis]|uniref:Acetoin utilization transport system permease protein n=1 Tax=Gracilibacillus kekensis TaxID=1027249 RepID=A0A1M7QKT0_9BACI|nr:FtsX-like permease family protein [Gracilibacillus kekensis]SHN31785.1 acetoin utilization transport system permease protein [Gracilibacillus kekensis]